MASQADLVADGLNKPMLAVAFAVIVVGFILTITVALAPFGLPLMALGVIWVFVLYGISWARARMVR